MHISPLPPDTQTAASVTTDRVTLCHVMAGPPALSDTFVSHEIGALLALGHAAVPVMLADGGAPATPEDAALCAEAIRLGTVDTMSAIGAAAANPAGLGTAVGFAQRQRAQPSRLLLRDAARLAHVVRSRGCGHIHAHSADAAAVAICAARIAGTTVSFTVLSSDMHGRRAPGHDTDLALKLAAADLAVAVNEDMAGRFRLLAPRAHIRAIPRGVATDTFRPLPGPTNGRLLAVGALASRKGYHATLVALSNLHPLLRPNLDVVGDGPLAAELAALARDLGLADTVRFLGARPPAWIGAEGPRYQGLIAAGTFAEDGTRDSAPLAIPEAMAMGLPVAATDLPGVREVMDESCGRLIEPGDISALAEAMVWLADLPADCRDRLGAAGRARVKGHFTLRHQAMRLMAAVAEAQG